MDKALSRIFIIYIFAFVFLLSCRLLGDGDFWFHLKTGEYIVHNHLIPRTEIFSFTNYGQPWVAHGWLSGVLFYLFYQWGGFNLLIFTFALLVTLTFWITFRRAESHPLINGCAVFLGFMSVLTNVGVRPRVFTLLLASVYLSILGRHAKRVNDRSVWWLIPLMCLWANLHGGFLIGFALLGLTIAGLAVDAWTVDEKARPVWPRVRTIAFVFTGCLLAGLVNPYGVRLYTFPLQIVFSKVFQQIVVDWMSPNFHERELLPFVLLLFLTIVAFVFSPKRPRPSEILFFLATLYASLKAQRNIVIFALVAVPLLAKYLQEWLESTGFGGKFAKASFSDPGPRSNLIILVALLPLFLFALRLKATVFVPPLEQITDVPVPAVEYLKEKQMTGNTFTDVNVWGGYVIWALPSNPVYIDGRDVYPEEFVKEYVDIILGLTDWRDPFRRYGVKIVIAKPKSVLGRELTESGEWDQVFQDQSATVFVAK